MRFLAASLVLLLALLLAAAPAAAIDDRAAKVSDGAVVTLAKGAVGDLGDLEMTRGYRKAGSTISV
jgi:hypothetical protein